MDYIALDECQEGTVYRLHSRNLSCGVFDGKNSFIGIREKFDHLFLDSEVHRDDRGTAVPLEPIGEIPGFIPLKMHLGSRDRITGRAVDFDVPVAEGGRGWFFLDDGESSQEIRPQAVGNNDLYRLMEEFTNERDRNHQNN